MLFQSVKVIVNLTVKCFTNLHKKREKSFSWVHKNRSKNRSILYLCPWVYESICCHSTMMVGSALYLSQLRGLCSIPTDTQRCNYIGNTVCSKQKGDMKMERDLMKHNTTMLLFCFSLFEVVPPRDKMFKRSQKEIVVHSSFLLKHPRCCFNYHNVTMPLIYPYSHTFTHQWQHANMWGMTWASRAFKNQSCSRTLKVTAVSV